jgi:hypothetical protein
MADMQRSFTRLAQTLKEELSGLFAGPVDKVYTNTLEKIIGTNGKCQIQDHQMLGDFGPTEEAASAHSGRLMAALSMAARQHHWAAEQLAMLNQGAAVAQQQRAMQAAAAAAAAPTAPFPGGRILPRGHPPAAAPGLPNPFQAFFAQNPLMAAMAAASAAHQQQQQQQYSTIASAAAGIPSAATASNGARGGGGAASIFPANTANGGFVPPHHPHRPFGPLPTAQQHHAQHQQPHFSRHRYTEAECV